MVTLLAVWICSFALALTCHAAAIWTLLERRQQPRSFAWILPPVAFYRLLRQGSYALCAVWGTSVIAYACCWVWL